MFDSGTRSRGLVRWMRCHSSLYLPPTREVRPGALAAPLEGMVVDELAGHRVVAVAQRLGAQRADHLRVAVVAALADVDVAAGQLQRGVGLQALDRLRGRALEEQRHDLDRCRRRSTTSSDQHDHQEVAGLDASRDRQGGHGCWSMACCFDAVRRPPRRGAGDGGGDAGRPARTVITTFQAISTCRPGTAGRRAGAPRRTDRWP